MSREDEYEAREDEMSAYVERPDEIEVQNGLSCWLNEERRCGPDCVAFNVSQLDLHGDPIAGPEACTALDTQISSVGLLRRVFQLVQDGERAKSQQPVIGGMEFKP